MRQPHRISAAVLCALFGLFGLGCQGEFGPIWFLGDYEPSTSQLRTELEFIPNAELVKVDTMPTWPLGRHAYRRGADRLLVMTRITSWADEEGNPDSPIRDREFERAWITLPVGTAIGQRLDVEELEFQFLTGYDQKSTRADGFYRFPNVMRGNITLVEERPDEVIMDINVEVRPKERDNWRIAGRFPIPVVPTGIHAKAADESDQLIIAKIRQRPGDEPEELNVTPTTAAQDDESPAGPTSVNIDPTLAQADPPDAGTNDPPQPNGDQPDSAPPSTTDPPPATSNNDTAAEKPAADDAGDGSDDGADPVVTKIAGKSILGKWYVNTAVAEFRFQFTDDGKFAYSRRVGDENDDIAPEMRYGTFKVKAGYVIMQYEKRQIAGRDFGLNQRFALVRGSWDGDNLIFDGDLKDQAGKVYLRLYQRGYDDLWSKLPPAGRAEADPPDNESRVYGPQEQLKLAPPK